MLVMNVCIVEFYLTRNAGRLPNDKIDTSRDQTPLPTSLLNSLTRCHWRLYFLPLPRACPASLPLLVSAVLSEKSSATGKARAMHESSLKLTTFSNPRGHLVRDTGMLKTRSLPIEGPTVHDREEVRDMGPRPDAAAVYLSVTLEFTHPSQVKAQHHARQDLHRPATVPGQILVHQWV